MMTYTEFQNAVLERIKIIKGRNCEVTIREVPKNNGIRLMGISIMEKGSDICPTITWKVFMMRTKRERNFRTLYRISVKFTDRI